MNNQIKNWKNLNVWLVGASDGIGAALARKLLAKGANVTLSSRREDKLNEIAQEYKNATVRALDVLDFDRAQKIVRDFKKLDLVIYMAADYSPMRSDELDAKRAGQIVDVNLKGAINIAAATLEIFKHQKEGHLSLVASIAGLIGLPHSSVYGSTKAALINFGESLYYDLKPLGLDISVVNPGFVKTRLTEKNDFDMPFIMTPEQAADHIIKGYEKGNFSITFPFVFSLFFRSIRVLPYSLHFKLLRMLVRT